MLILISFLIFSIINTTCTPQHDSKELPANAGKPAGKTPNSNSNFSPKRSIDPYLSMANEELEYLCFTANRDSYNCNEHGYQLVSAFYRGCYKKIYPCCGALLSYDRSVAYYNCWFGEKGFSGCEELVNIVLNGCFEDKDFFACKILPREYVYKGLASRVLDQNQWSKEKLASYIYNYKALCEKEKKYCGLYTKLLYENAQNIGNNDLLEEYFVREYQDCILNKDPRACSSIIPSAVDNTILSKHPEFSILYKEYIYEHCYLTGNGCDRVYIEFGKHANIEKQMELGILHEKGRDGSNFILEKFIISYCKNSKLPKLQDEYCKFIGKYKEWINYIGTKYKNVEYESILKGIQNRYFAKFPIKYHQQEKSRDKTPIIDKQKVTQCYQKFLKIDVYKILCRHKQ